VVAVVPTLPACCRQSLHSKAEQSGERIAIVPTSSPVYTDLRGPLGLGTHPPSELSWTTQFSQLPFLPSVALIVRK
jgi:hypothetical protein